MTTFIMLTRLSSEGLDTPQSIEPREKEVMRRIRSQCPEVEWVHNYALLGPYDYLDIFNAPDVESATKVATLVRTFGHAQTEIWAATEWARYKDMLHRMPSEAA